MKNEHSNCQPCWDHAPLQVYILVLPCIILILLFSVGRYLMFLYKQKNKNLVCIVYLSASLHWANLKSHSQYNLSCLCLFISRSSILIILNMVLKMTLLFDSPLDLSTKKERVSHLCFMNCGCHRGNNVTIENKNYMKDVIEV